MEILICLQGLEIPSALQGQRPASESPHMSLSSERKIMQSGSITSISSLNHEVLTSPGTCTAHKTAYQRATTQFLQPKQKACNQEMTSLI
eukprot:899068-Pelagomonas_calceolata.AAC.4